MEKNIMYQDLKVGISLECSSSREKASEAIALNRGEREERAWWAVLWNFINLARLQSSVTQSNTNLGVAVKVLCRYN